MRVLSVLQMQRYPPPIQRPVNFQQNLGSVQQNNNAVNQKHRANNSNKAPARQYYQSEFGGFWFAGFHVCNSTTSQKFVELSWYQVKLL